MTHLVSTRFRSVLTSAPLVFASLVTGGLLGLVAPAGPVYQAGTLSGNPLATAAGLAVLGELSEEARQWPDLIPR